MSETHFTPSGTVTIAALHHRNSFIGDLVDRQVFEDSREAWWWLNDTAQVEFEAWYGPLSATVPLKDKDVLERFRYVLQTVPFVPRTTLEEESEEEEEYEEWACGECAACPKCVL